MEAQMSFSIPPAVAATCDPIPQVNPGQPLTARDDAAIARGKHFDDPRITHYSVFNRITGKTSIFKTGKRATDAVDRMDNAYGAYICTRRAHWSDEA
jgi:hypothetical protein